MPVSQQKQEEQSRELPLREHDPSLSLSLSLSLWLSFTEEASERSAGSFFLKSLHRARVER